MSATHAAIIVGAGSGVRFGSDKIFADLAGMPVLAHTIAAFEACPTIDEIVLVLRTDTVQVGQQLVRIHGWRKVIAVVAGGARRQDSVLAGTQATTAQWVLIHDAARPLISREVIERGIDAAQSTGAAIAAIPVRDTIKRVNTDRSIRETVDRAPLWAAQTPQVFQTDLLRRALTEATDVTDDAAAVEAVGGVVHVFEGAERNFKITTTADLALAAAILRAIE